MNTNPLCLVRSEIVNDRSEPTVEVSLGKIIQSILIINTSCFIHTTVHVHLIFYGQFLT